MQTYQIVCLSVSTALPTYNQVVKWSCAHLPIDNKELRVQLE